MLDFIQWHFAGTAAWWRLVENLCSLGQCWLWKRDYCGCDLHGVRREP